MHSLSSSKRLEEATATIYKKHSEELALQRPDGDMTFKHQSLDFAVFQSALPWERMAGAELCFPFCFFKSPCLVGILLTSCYNCPDAGDRYTYNMI